MYYAVISEEEETSFSSRLLLCLGPHLIHWKDLGYLLFNN